MDFSQLPKMSKTPVTPKPDESEIDEPADVDAVDAPPAEPSSPRERIVYVAQPHAAPAVGFGGAWLSIIAGIIFIAMGKDFARYVLAKLGGREMATGWLQSDGVTPVRYFELQGGTAWSDTSLFLMGLALLIDAALLGILAARGRPGRSLVLVGISITVVALILNAGVSVYLFSIGVFPLASLVALAVGGFIVFDHAPLLRRGSRQ